MNARLLKLFLLAVAVLPGPAQSAQGELFSFTNNNDTLSITAEIWCPYACEPESERPGILVEIVREIFAREGIAVDYTLLPWRRAIVETERGGFDGILGVVEGNRGSLLLDEAGLGVDETVVVLRKDTDFHFAGPQSLDSLRLGVIANYTYDNNGELDRYLQKRLAAQDRMVTIYRDEPIKSLINMLSGNRIDAFLENRQVTNYESNRLNFKDQIAITSTGLGDTIHVGFTPDSAGKRNLDIYNRGFARLLKSGRVGEIFKRYGLEEIPATIKIPSDEQD